MSYRIIKHPLVESDLLDITDFISSYVGLEIGKSKVDEITSFISKLRQRRRPSFVLPSMTKR